MKIRYAIMIASLAACATAQTLPEGPGKETFVKVCAECHGLDLATGQKQTKEGWQAIVEYLTKNFGAAKVTADASKVMPEGAGKQIILRECTACHLPDHFVKYQHTPEEWQGIVVRMGTRVRSASKEELETVQKYLAVNFPKVQDASKLNVNKASAKEIEARLSLSPSEAAALVDYRSRHGEFREWGDLLAIYGVEGEKIAAAKDRMSF